MRKLLHYLLFLLLIATGISLVAQAISLRATIQGVVHPKKCYLYAGHAVVALDSALAAGDTYTFRVPAGESFYRISAMVYAPTGEAVTVYFAADQEDVSCFLNVTAAGVERVVFSHCLLQQAYVQAYGEILSRYKLPTRVIDSPWIQEIEECAMQVNHQLFAAEVDFVNQYVRQHPASLVSVDLLMMHGNRFAFEGFSPNGRPEVFWELYDLIKSSARPHPMLVELDAFAAQFPVAR